MEIELKDVTYKKILKNINLIFKEKEITSIIGKNSSGITELLNLIYNSIVSDDGIVTINSKENSNPVRQQADVFYLIEDYKNQLFNINILEDIKYGNKKFNDERLYELLKLFNLDSKILTKNYLEISNGEKKKIMIILGILRNKKIIILDNPTSGLDYKGIQTLLKLLREEKRAGKIIIITEKNTDFLLSVSDRVIVIDNKKVIADGSRFEIFENTKLLKKVCIGVPNICNFRNRVLDLKGIKLEHRDNINDLIKDIYRHAK